MLNRKFHFGILSLLLLIACFGGMFGGFHIGGRMGQSAGEKQRASEVVVPRVYQVGDLLDKKSNGAEDFEPLRAKITKLDEQSWSELGGPATMDMVDLHQIIINQTSDMHDRIVRLLAAMRDERRSNDSAASNNKDEP